MARAWLRAEYNHAQFVPKWLLALTFAQVKELQPEVCKPSAKPTQVRTLDLPPEKPRSDPVGWIGSGCVQERSG